MKYLFTITLTIAFFTNSFSQITEYCIQLNSGLFYFSGISAESTGQINYNIDREDGYTNNPYGAKPGLSYGVSANLARITMSNFRIKLNLGYELLKSKIDINTVWQHSNLVNESIEVEGQTYLSFNNINLFPSFGYRFLISDFNIDIDAGLDFAYILKATEKGSAASSLREYKTVRDRKSFNTDFRLRFQISVSKNKIGGYVGYSKGIRNYKSDYIGGTHIAFSNIIRFGIIYKLK